jgi:hypothetical protein
MPKKIYNFNYDYHKAEVKFEVDLEKFTPKLANETLTFFSWDYDHEADPIDEVMKKYAMAVLIFSLGFGGIDTDSLIKRFDAGSEGFARIDGTMGILMVDFEPFELDDNDLEMEVSNA